MFYILQIVSATVSISPCSRLTLSLIYYRILILFILHSWELEHSIKIRYGDINRTVMNNFRLCPPDCVNLYCTECTILHYIHMVKQHRAFKTNQEP